MTRDWDKIIETAERNLSRAEKRLEQAATQEDVVAAMNDITRLGRHVKNLYAEH